MRGANSAQEGMAEIKVAMNKDIGSNSLLDARMAELVDALDLKSSGQ